MQATIQNGVEGVRPLVMRTLGRVAYGCGALGTFHRSANAQTLTAAMFHRVLPASDHRWEGANRTWTVSLSVFERCLDFFTRHYHPVSAADVLAAAAGEKRLPERALLVTFDDGWSDNEEFALPALQRSGVPGVMFLTAGAIDGDEIWHEPLLRARGEGRLTPEDCAGSWERALGRAYEGEADAPAFAIALAALSQKERRAVLGRLAPVVPAPEAGAMLSRRQIVRMADAGIEIGSHGSTHLPMARLADAGPELAGARAAIEAATGRSAVTLSFPHGSYDRRIAQQALASYRLLFTSDAILNDCPGGRPSALLGRIPIIEADLVDGRGRLDASKLARWLFLRPRRALDAPQASAVLAAK